MTKKKIIVGIAAGVAVGGIIGYLFATEKGAETRKKIVDETGSFFEDVAGFFMDFIQKGRDNAETAIAAASDSLEKVKMSGNI